MKCPSKPKVVELDVEELEANLDQIERVLGEQTARPFRLLLSWYLSLLQLIQEKNASISRLRRLLFGARTERTRNIVPREDLPEARADRPADASGPSPLDDTWLDKETDSRAESTASCPRAAGRRRPRRGHGRIPAAAYTGCESVVVTHGSFRPGDPCSHCQEGTLYRLREWGHVVRLRGQPPVGGACYELERLRCGLCGKMETADLPEDAGSTKYDPTVASTLAVLRYGHGMPFKRIERMQQSAGIPLPSSVQWEVVRDAVGRGLEAVYRQLLGEAAQGDLLHNDDTSMRILELSVRINRRESIRDDDPHRRGVYTTSILSVAEDRPPIALFFTGPRHSGENLRDLLAERMAGQPPPMQMCDALSRNMPGDLQTIVANCLSHSRRNFVEVADIFRDEVRYVLECFKKVYQIDGQAKQEGLSPQDRLRLHQQESGSVMEELHQWLHRQFDQRRVEPNSSLGRAISYMLKHWQKLTLFLRVPGAPLDNNICERALKMSIRHRKNSLFYKTLRGAQVGDVYMSLILTCQLSQVDPLAYLTALQQNHQQVVAAPADWLPWNYQQ